jgi:hypothetical protein
MKIINRMLNNFLIDHEINVQLKKRSMDRSVWASMDDNSTTETVEKYLSNNLRLVTNDVTPKIAEFRIKIYKLELIENPLKNNSMKY